MLAFDEELDHERFREMSKGREKATYTKELQQAKVSSQQHITYQPAGRREGRLQREEDHMLIPGKIAKAQEWTLTPILTLTSPFSQSQP